ncbi:MAG: cysteine desulfurase family protein [Phycisphaerae bacterium]|nr:IscS subfamily cysteine desulfurase [Tepidisphaeraceae bacterium]
MTPIYLDHNATTPLDPRVFEAMRPFFMEAFGNAASRGHAFGFRAARAVDQARVQIAALIGCDVKEIVWTSGATESNNLAIKGVADMYEANGRHIITQTTEHKAVLDPCKKLSHRGYEITWLDPDPTGRVAAEQVRAAIRPDTILVSIMAANNEIGTLQPVREIGQVCRAAGVIFHCDATQAIGKVPVNVETDCVDLLSMSAHKLYGPKGAGALYVRRQGPRVRLTPLLDGGGHEHGFRSGTLNVPGIVGLGAACEMAMLEMSQEAPRLAGLRDRLQAALMARVPGVRVNGNEAHRLPNVTNLAFPGVDGEHLLASVAVNLAVSSGSACTSASMEPSYVLRALGVPTDLAYASIRFSLGRANDAAQIDYAVDEVVSVITRLKEMTPMTIECAPG